MNVELEAMLEQTRPSAEWQLNQLPTLLSQRLVHTMRNLLNRCSNHLQLLLMAKIRLVNPTMLP